MAFRLRQVLTASQQNTRLDKRGIRIGKVLGLSVEVGIYTEDILNDS